jgi:hypothetical protein
LGHDILSRVAAGHDPNSDGIKPSASFFAASTVPVALPPRDIRWLPALSRAWDASIRQFPESAYWDKN